MKQILVFLVLVVAAIACIPLIPLSAAVSAAHLDKFGFAASAVEGNLWSGKMYDVQVGKIAFGDVTSQMSVADLAKGRVRLQLKGSDQTTNLNGGFSYGLGGLGLEGFSMGVPAVGAAPPLGGITLFVTDLSMRFSGGVCNLDGGGTAHAYIAGASPGLGIPDSISGPIVCRDGHMVFDLMTDDAQNHEVLTVLEGGSYRVRLTVKQSAPAIVNALLAKGFVSQPEGYVYEVERKL